MTALTTSSRTRILVLGGGYAGLLAARRASRARDAEVTLLDAREAFLPRIRLHEGLTGGVVARIAYAPLLARRGVRFLRGRAAAIDLARRVVRLEGGGEVAWDRLVYAPGSRAARPAALLGPKTQAWDGEASVREARARVAALPAGARVAVVGAGLTGIEIASEVAEARPDLRVAILSRGAPFADFAPRGAAHLRASLERGGVALVAGFEAVSSSERGLVAADGRGHEADLVLLAAGFEVPPLAREAGLAVDAEGRVLVDARLRSMSHPEVLACGDAAAFESVRMGCASAMPMGCYAGDAVAAEALREAPPPPYGFSFALRCISLGRKDALVQLVEADDAPRPRVLTGRIAAWVKEAICRMTVAAIRAEYRLGVRVYRWPGMKAAAAEPPPAQISARLAPAAAER